MLQKTQSRLGVPQSLEVNDALQALEDGLGALRLSDCADGLSS